MKRVENHVDDAVNFVEEKIGKQDYEMTAQEIVRKYEYKFERHYYETIDGYINTLFRIPGKSN